MPAGDNGLYLLIAVLVLTAAVVVIAALVISSEKREREKLLLRLEHESKRQSRDSDRLSRSVGESVRQMAELGGRMDELTRQSGEQMTQMRGIVDARLGEAFDSVNARLGEVHKGLGEMRGMSAGIADLRRVLGNVKTRGVWGEMLLGNILAEMFAPDMYIADAAIPEDSRQRVEFALKLTDRERGTALLPIDSKFPQEDYIRLTEAQAAADRARIEQCTKQLEQALILQAKTISEKYIRPPQTVDFAVMFLPAESLYAEAARMDGFISKVQTKYRVLVAGPSTLCALLTSLQMGFRSQQLERRSSEALERIDLIRAECEKLAQEVIDMRKHLNQTESDLDKIESRVRSVGKKLS